MNRIWWTPLTGVAFIIVLIASFVIMGEPPEAGDGASEIAEFYVDDKDAIMLGAALSGWAAVLLVLFANVLRVELRGSEGAESLLSPVVLVGAAILATGAGIDGTLSFAMAEAADDIEPASLQTLQALWDNDFLPMAIGLSSMMLAAGITITRTGHLPIWLGWIAVGLGILAITPAGFVAFIGSAVWILIVSVMLTMRRRNAVGPTTPSAPAAPATPAA